MRWRQIWVLAIAAAVSGFSAASAWAQDTRPGIAVMPFENGGSYGLDKEDFEALEVGIQQMMLTEFATNSGLRVVDRSQIDQLLQEQDLGASGRVDAETAARVGKLVGAKYMVMGGFIDFYGDFRIDVRVVNVETSEIVKTERVRNQRDNLYDMVVQVANETVNGLDLPALAQNILQERQEREVPGEAVRLYSRALMWEKRGEQDRAAELFNRALEVFPEYTEAQEGLQQLQQG